MAMMAQAVEIFRQASAANIADLHRLLAEARRCSQTRSGGRELSFVNTKTFEGCQLGGGAKENFKAWSKKAKQFLCTLGLHKTRKKQK